VLQALQHPNYAAMAQVVTSYSLARLLGDIPTSRGGPTSCCIVDMHSLHVGSAMLVAPGGAPDACAWARKA